MASNSVIIVLINPKSGGKMGIKLLKMFRNLLGEEKVYNLCDDQNFGPKKALEDYKDVDNLRIIACGGDGTAGWVLSVMDNMEFPNGPPSIGMIPLGTGNDLSRSLKWGGKYKDEPLENIITDIENADVVKMDRWTLEVTPIISDFAEENMENSHLTATDNAEKNLPLNVFNNYFNLGIDASVALKFHQARDKNPQCFSHRINNLLYYGFSGVKNGLIMREWSDLMEYVSIECDGKDYTKELKEFGVHSIMFLNIKSYAGGTKPWDFINSNPADMNDGLIEMVAVTNIFKSMSKSALHMNGSWRNICQCKSAVIKTSIPIPMKVDGEPCLMKPSKIEITLDPTGTPEAHMLRRNKRSFCEF